MKFKVSLLLFFAFTLSAPEARADVITFTITSPINVGLPAGGGATTVQGTLTNTTGAPLTITFFGFNTSAQIGTFDTTALVAVPFVLQAGETTAVMDLFTITGTPSTHPGDAGSPAFGSFSIVAIGTLNGQRAILGISDPVNVGIGHTPVPEPATLLLLGTGLAGVVGAARRRRKASRE